MCSLNRAIRRAITSAVVGTCIGVDRLPRRALDLAPHVLLTGGHEEDGFASPSSPPGAPDAVDVGVGIVGHIVIDHPADALHIQATRGHVRRHDELHVAAPQTAHHGFPLCLTHIPMDRLGHIAPRLELLGEFGGPHLGTRENQHRLTWRGLNLQDMRQCVELLTLEHVDIVLRHRRHGRVLCRISTVVGCFR